jgi:hypothetical protein
LRTTDKNNLIHDRRKDFQNIQPVKPKRYLWHVTRKHNRNSIIQHGLRTELSAHKCIFANNQSRNIDFFYPFCIHLFYETFEDEQYLEYDYWRIDTKKVKADWFIDPNMKNGPKEYMGSSKNFLFTQSSIPKEALRLFKIDARFLRSWNTTAVLYELENGDREICCYGSEEKIDYGNKIIKIKEFTGIEISRIREDVSEGVVHFIATDLPLVVDDSYRFKVTKNKAA